MISYLYHCDSYQDDGQGNICLSISGSELFTIEVLSKGIFEHFIAALN